MLLALTALAIFFILAINELIWRKHKLHGEINRKFVHLIVGIYAAFWPFYLSWNEIELFSLVLVGGVIFSKQLKVFKGITNIKRTTWGEVCFGLSIGAVALITNNKWIYAASILQMGLADGLAAVIGLKLGKSNSYKVFGHIKSAAGTSAFLISSIVIFLAYSHFASVPLSLSLLVGASLGATILENLAVKGLDDLLVPVFVALLLTNH